MSDVLTLGPLVLSLQRLLAVASVALFVALFGRLTRRAPTPPTGTALLAIFAGLIAARAGYVGQHLDRYRGDPLAMAGFGPGEGGFSPTVGCAVVVLVLVWRLRGGALRGGLAALALAAGTWLAGTAFLTRAAAPVPLPAGLVVRALDGRPVPLDAYRGRPFVLSLWATWCGPCRTELPMLVDVARTHPAVPIVLLDQGESPEVVTNFLARRSLAPPHVLLDPEQVVMRSIGTGVLPTTLFIDGHGRVRRRHVGVLSLAQIDDELKALLEPAT